jgi:hypothetical protein
VAARARVEDKVITRPLEGVGQTTGRTGPVQQKWDTYLVTGRAWFSSGWPGDAVVAHGYCRCRCRGAAWNSFDSQVGAFRSREETVPAWTVEVTGDLGSRAGIACLLPPARGQAIWNLSMASFRT